MELHKLGSVLTTIGGILSSIGTRLVVQHAEELEKSVAAVAREHYMLGRAHERDGVPAPDGDEHQADEHADGHQVDASGYCGKCEASKVWDVDEHQGDEHADVDERLMSADYTDKATLYPQAATDDETKPTNVRKGVFGGKKA